MLWNSTGTVSRDSQSQTARTLFVVHNEHLVFLLHQKRQKRVRCECRETIPIRGQTACLL
jgi:hypothetical protein